MSKQSHVFKTVIARRIPDPVFKKQFDTERHLFVMNVKDVPRNLSTEPNARNPNINKQVYRIVESSLLNKQEGAEPNSFHLKNKGITIIAESVEQHGNNEYLVILDGGHGIVDGGHTYELICNHIDAQDLPDEQYVNVEIRTGIRPEWIQQIAGGLNTGVQVQAMSLDNLAGKFEPLKTELQKFGFASSIAWSENDEGEMNARDLISLMLMFNIQLYPNDSNNHPVQAYTSKAAALKRFEEASATFYSMRRILKDILILQDLINSDAGRVWVDEGGKAGTIGRPGALKWMEYKAPTGFRFQFLQEARSETRLLNGALYPILAAFRWFVEYDDDQMSMVWKIPFNEIKEVWNNTAIQLLRATAEMCDALGNNPNALGKLQPHWGNMYNIVKAHKPEET